MFFITVILLLNLDGLDRLNNYSNESYGRRLNESNSVLSLQLDVVPDELYTPMSPIRG